MAAGILPNEGIGDQLSYILSADIDGVLPWELMLWTNDYTPDYDTVLDDLVEATWTGYSRQTLTRDEWTTPEVDAGCATSTWGTEPITLYVGMGPIETNYGAAYVDTSSGVLRWVQRFDDADIFPIEVGGRFVIQPVYTLTSAECMEMTLAARRKARRKPKR